MITDPEIKAATRDRNRVCKRGQEMGAQMARMTDPEIQKLIAEGEMEKDERCASCAFRLGTVPNGCLQTQLDALKSVMEKVPFLCHCTEAIGDKVCMGWFAARQALAGKEPIPCPWPFSNIDGGYDEAALEKAAEMKAGSVSVIQPRKELF